MEGSTKIGCSFEGRKYVHGEKHCLSDRCEICEDGRWEEKTEIFVL
jgi:hypothetical protein